MSNDSSPSDILLAYVPVLHRGYTELFRNLSSVDTMYVLGSDVLADIDYLRKELRALVPEEAVCAINAQGIFSHVTVIHKPDLLMLNSRGRCLIMPDEDVSHTVGERFLNKATITFKPVFLRWHRDNADLPQTVAGVRVSVSPDDIAFMRIAYDEAVRSPDVWRHVGAVLVQNGKVLAKASNQPLTTQNTPWAEGDPRAVFNRGVRIEMSTFMHAEARLVANAAKQGTILKGTAMYVTTFPCPPCAMLLAESGVSRCFYTEGYALLDGARVLGDAGVDLLHVPITVPIEHDRLISYPEW